MVDIKTERLLATKYQLKENHIRIFANESKSGREPDFAGKLYYMGKIYFCGVWKNVSRSSGKPFYKGLLHEDGKRGVNCGALTLYPNKFYAPDTTPPLPFIFGRLKLQTGIQAKVHLWKNTRVGKPDYYSGVIRNN